MRRRESGVRSTRWYKAARSHRSGFGGPGPDDGQAPPAWAMRSSLSRGECARQGIPRTRRGVACHSSGLENGWLIAGYNAMYGDTPCPAVSVALGGCRRGPSMTTGGALVADIDARSRARRGDKTTASP